MDVEGTSVKEGKSPPKRLVPHPDLGTVVTRAFDMALAREGMAVIRDYLSSTSPRKWTITAVKNLLTNEVYMGILRYGPNRNEAAHEALVSPETWDAVQAVTEQSKRS